MRYLSWKEFERLVNSLVSIGLWKIKFVQDEHANDEQILNYCTKIRKFNLIYIALFVLPLLSGSIFAFIFNEHLYVPMGVTLIGGIIMFAIAYFYTCTLPEGTQDFVKYAKQYIKENENR